MSEHKKISSITSLYKSEKFLKNFVDQLYNQTIFKNIEIIIIDCNEDNQDYNIIKDFCKEPNVIYEKVNPDPGLYAAWNEALTYVSTPYVSNSNTDDVKAPWYFETMLHYMRQNQECDVAYGLIGKTFNPAKPFYEDFAPEIWAEHWQTNLSTITYSNPPHCMPVWRTDIHEDVGFFDTQYDIKADWDFWMRCLKQNKRFDGLNILMGNYYFNENGATLGNMKKNQEEGMKILNNHFPNRSKQFLYSSKK